MEKRAEAAVLALAATAFLHLVTFRGGDFIYLFHKATTGVWVDEGGVVLIDDEHGVGTIHDRDLERLVPCLVDAHDRPMGEEALDGVMEALERGQPAEVWLRFSGSKHKIEPITTRDVPKRFGFVAQPEPPAGEEVCR